MFWERVSEEIYIFTSDRYALVNSTAVLTKAGIVIIDAPPFPKEARQVARFLPARTRLKYHSLLLTHYHMDHVYGLHAFPSSLDVLGHELCRQRLLEVGEASLEKARRSDPMFEEVTLRYPTITFSGGELRFVAGNKTLRLIHLPGHSLDNTGVLLEEDHVLIAGDAVMAIPIIADGDWETEIATLRKIQDIAPETIIQGHGEIILRGEVQTVLDRYISYLECVYEQAETMLRTERDRKEIWDIPLEACGLERVPLGVASHQLHIANILSIYDKLKVQAKE